MVGNAFDERVEFDAESFGFHHKVFDFVVEEVRAVGCRGWDSLSDDGPEAGLHLEEALGYKFSDHFMRRIGLIFRSWLRARTDGNRSPGAISPERMAFLAA
jgi:hypothetical protein